MEKLCRRGFYVFLWWKMGLWWVVASAWFNLELFFFLFQWSCDGPTSKAPRLQAKVTNIDMVPTLFSLFLERFLWFVSCLSSCKSMAFPAALAAFPVRLCQSVSRRTMCPWQLCAGLIWEENRWAAGEHGGQKLDPEMTFVIWRFEQPRISWKPIVQSTPHIAMYQTFIHFQSSLLTLSNNNNHHKIKYLSPSSPFSSLRVSPSSRLLERLRRRTLGAVRLFVTYGPTEAAVDSSTWEATERQLQQLQQTEVVRIGWPDSFRMVEILGEVEVLLGSLTEKSV